MATKQKIVGFYCDRSIRERMNFIFENYRDFEQFHKAYRKSIEEKIFCIRNYERRKENHLGVRIMGGQTISDITAQKAIENLEISDNIAKGNIAGLQIQDEEDRKEIETAVLEWQLMRHEFEIFRQQLLMLKTSDYDILFPYINKEKSRKELAKELEIERGSIDKRIYRIRRILMDRMVSYLKE